MVLGTRLWVIHAVALRESIEALIYLFVFVVSSCFHSKARTYFYAYATKGHMKGTIAHSPRVNTLEVSFGAEIYGTWSQSSPLQLMDSLLGGSPMTGERPC